MSLFGKILAFLNILGAAGLFYLANVDYGKRSSWAYSVVRHELVLDGLPSNEQELDRDSKPLVDRLNQQALKDIFAQVGGKEVPTQTKEVERIKSELDARLQPLMQNRAQQSYHLARILLPLADSYLERDTMMSVRAHLANDKTTAALKDRCQLAFQEALKPGKPADAPATIPESSFHEVFRRAFRGQSGEPADTFITEMLRLIPDDRAKARETGIEKPWELAIAKQHDALVKRYQGLFSEALGTAAEAQRPAPGQDPQKIAIARLLFGLCTFQAEDAILTDPGKEAERKQIQTAKANAVDQQKLVATETYKQLVRRVHVVCGLRSSLGAMNERASVLRRLSDYAADAITQEKQQFIVDHGFVVDMIREQLSLARAEFALINENKERLSAYEDAVGKRVEEIKGVKADLKKLRDETSDERKKLRVLSSQILEQRQTIRRNLADIERGEKTLRKLELMIQELEKDD